MSNSRYDCSLANIRTLQRVVQQYIKDVPGIIIEAGAYRCGTTIEMADAGRDRRVLAFDVFGGLPYGPGRGFENFADADYEEIKRAVAPRPNIELVRGLHEETVPYWPPEPIALLFMDSDHESSHRVCLKHFVPQLSKGSYIVFHDWTFEGVQRAINDQFEDRSDYDGFTTFADSPNMGFIRRIR